MSEVRYCSDCVRVGKCQMAKSLRRFREEFQRELYTFEESNAAAFSFGFSSQLAVALANCCKSYEGKDGAR